MPALPFRVANQEELRKYKEEIVPFQNMLFSALAPLEDNIYLTGGTALARFYYEHRISEDLDFFTTHATLKDILPSVLSILEKEGFNVEVEHVSVSFARLFVNGYKLELIVEPNHYGELIKTDYGIYVNNLEDIGANKISAWEDRAEWKDLIDLYYITKDIPLTKLFEIADMKRVPVAYEMFLGVNVHGIRGSALLIKEVSEKEILNFVEDLKTAVEDNLKKKEEEILQNLDEWIKRLLWDFPPEQRKIDENSIRVLLRRVEKASLPLRRVILSVL
ncbi:nucleotidyl transferase AbiEii/AbiGii toxin family protein [Hydrogenobacter hydrogenophilus]|uniref:Nucleotidyl transferase AbiEii toxin, Type IV TA system n=1 Tax=Hydrogenobacter hydrogenophilus TaxID=35835 RepID=A0A285P248_9AQUI|nr:nucleotidyl transferase AbiEii/AbiGii toxin family protein [Hydrogenobacter hydrogenophilus]SNZ15528.1 Nucleotidyl transferase AbiEii toxin, Type IV TA system [Hydrogenobacter hydrogenophilus]